MQPKRPSRSQNVNAWLASEKWTEAIPSYNSMSPFDQQEFKRAMQVASDPHLYQQWQSTKKMLLCHIRDHDTVMGKTTAVFCRDEYQGTTGNLCHNHTITETEMSFKEADNDNVATEDMENHTHTPMKQTTKHIYETSFELLPWKLSKEQQTSRDCLKMER